MAFQVTDVIDRSSELWRTLHALPKIELHRHLEGSIRLETLVEVGKQYDLTLPAYEPEELRPFVQMTAQDAQDSQTFLSKFEVLRRFFCAPEVITRVVRECIEDAAADQIRYMELRFTPNALAKAKGFPLHEVVDWVCHTTREAEKANNIRVNLIVSMNRHENLEIGEKTLEVALENMGRGVVALDLAGKEPGFPARPFSNFFREAKRAGLGVTIHASEWEGSDNVRDAIENMRTDRIGHGVRAVEDSEVIKLARERQIAFEVCPTSNLQTGVVGYVGHHPVLDLHYLNIPITINTDDPAIHGVTLTDEYALAIQGLGMSQHDIHEIILRAAQVSFLPLPEREQLVQSLKRELGTSQYRGISH